MSSTARVHIGRYPMMSLAQAREKALGLRKLLDLGIDPKVTQAYCRPGKAAPEPGGLSAADKRRSSSVAGRS